MDLVKYLDKNYPDLVKFAQSLIRVNSVNGNETEIAELIQEKLLQYGVKSKLFGKNKKRKNLMAKIKGNGKDSFLLNGHLDTVPVGDVKKWKFSPFSAKMINGKIFGRGALDMKGCVASSVFSVISLIESNTELDGDLFLVFNGQEQGGNHEGIREVLKRGLDAEVCIIGEPGPKNTIDIGSRGIYRFELIVKGKTAPTAYSEKGENAILNALHLLSALQKMKFENSKNKFFPPFTINFSVIKGGIALNVVPDECSIFVDCRLTLNQTKQDVLKKINKNVVKIMDKKKFFNAKINELAYIKPYFLSEKEKIVRLAAKNMKKICGEKVRLRIGRAASDANLLVEAGIPSITFGPVGGNSHSENEFVFARSLLSSSKIFALTAREFLSSYPK